MESANKGDIRIRLRKDSMTASRTWHGGRFNQVLFLDLAKDRDAVGRRARGMFEVNAKRR